ncbi:hypothetical protein ACQKK5_08150 [Brevibacillus panacihumi]|uniref:hypothetical protein n=1 Tax=Brevibacillus panacihumi TaxID=497735 RepID=UPI003D03505D
MQSELRTMSHVMYSDDCENDRRRQRIRELEAENERLRHQKVSAIRRAREIIGRKNDEIHRLTGNSQALYDTLMEALEYVPGEWTEECRDIAARIRADIFGEEATAYDPRT